MKTTKAREAKKTTERAKRNQGNVSPSGATSRRPEAMETIWINPNEALRVSVGVRADRTYYADVRMWDVKPQGMFASVVGVRFPSSHLPKLIRALKRLDVVTRG
jgi:hypothetical protein